MQWSVMGRCFPKLAITWSKFAVLTFTHAPTTLKPYLGSQNRGSDIKGHTFVPSISFVLCLIILGLLMFRCQAAQNNWGEETMTEQRQKMLDQLKRYGIVNKEVLQTMERVRRHVFIPENVSTRAPYGDHPCPIGHGQTISQPYICAYMTERLQPKKGDKIGTGSGYQAAILADLGANVFSVEIVPELASHARSILKQEGYSVQVRTGDGYQGWSENAPFDIIIVTCAPEEIPQALVDQLREGGRMMLPVGAISQRLVMLQKTNGQIIQEEDLPVRFVPMVHTK